VPRVGRAGHRHPVTRREAGATRSITQGGSMHARRFYG
jgi:hypothetical protein